MLFAYTYVPHQMEKMQEFIDFIFFEVWCKAPANGSFDLNLFADKPDLHEVMQAFYYSDAKGADFFYGHVERIYGLFAALTPSQINQFQQWYYDNNDIEKICANDPTIHIVRYTDIPVAHQDLIELLKSFFKGLYSQTLLDLASLREKIGDIDEHYKAFVEINKADRCSFCGISDLFGEYHSMREAYDHYLPKALYPFNSINFRNLVPACHHCNSSYKTSKDPAYTAKDPMRGTQRRAVFYPYTATPYAIELQVTLQHTNIEKLTPADVNLHFGPAELDEKIDTWKDVYGIEERYKAKFCSSDALDWLEQVRILDRDHSVAPTAYLASLGTQAKNSPVANCNFLKKPFLDACKLIGVFDVMSSGLSL